ncbi:MAG: saccharopine dehydrogenase C-terminal domain-containing protein [Xanthomonadales bacterium]|nr:saccharopine dehydrogenase C-terminal domain-containing protein [Xanthomonadales bacterium]
MNTHIKHVDFAGKMVMVGCGSIGQGVLPLILRHIGIDPGQITIITADARGREEAGRYGIAHHEIALTRDNFREVLEGRLDEGDFLVNVSVDVSSTELVRLCHERGALYIDTCIEPWPGVYTDTTAPPAKRTNYALRETMLALRQDLGDGPTAVVAHGANPGLVSHFVKQALINIAADTGHAVEVPTDQPGWAALARDLGIKAIHIAERDTQVATVPKRPGEFVNTWSIDGFVSEGCQPAEMGWGTHEKTLPHDGEIVETGTARAAILLRPGASVRVRTWTPNEGPFHGFLITHNESISLNDYFTVRENGTAVYRPTVHYAYHPSDDAVLSVHEFAGKNWHMQSRQRLLMDEIESGIDELGVLLMGHAKGAYWYGSQLSIEEARELVPYNNATSLQVTVAVLSGIVWALENPQAGIVEAEQMNFARHLEICGPYLGPVVGAYSNWTPLQDRAVLFGEDIDPEDPWQFKNVRVV